MSAIRVTTEDLETGQKETAEITDDYVLVTAGSCYLAHTNAYARTGTHILTIKHATGVADGARTD
jgi:hypothetical protein